MEWTVDNDRVYVNSTRDGLGNDQSIPSTLSVLPNVIEKSQRTVIAHGLADYILIAEGTRIAIQCASFDRCIH
jgi:carboxypeptidase D